MAIASRRSNKLSTTDITMRKRSFQLLRPRNQTHRSTSFVVKHDFRNRSNANDSELLVQIDEYVSPYLCMTE